MLRRLRRCTFSNTGLLFVLVGFIYLFSVLSIDNLEVNVFTTTTNPVPCRIKTVTKTQKILGDSFVIHKSYFYHLLKNQPTIYTFDMEWKINRNICEHYFTSSNLNSKNIQLVNLKSENESLPIFTHDPYNDVISYRLAKTSVFEPRADEVIWKIMSQFPDAILVDIGINIGVKALQVLNSKRKVIGFEALNTNIQHLCLSSAINQFSENLTLIYNAVSDSHKNVTFAVGTKGDLSQNYVADSSDIKQLKDEANGKTFFTNSSKPIPTVVLDDLLTFPKIHKFKSNGRQSIQCFIKMDVEGYEDAVLRGSKKFFRENDVIGMILEWRWHKPRNESALSILDFIIANNMVIYDYWWNPLSPSNYSVWPNDIFGASSGQVGGLKIKFTIL